VRQVGYLPRIITRCAVNKIQNIDTIDSPDDEHKVSRNMYRIEINT